jgi:hypothetical protein
MLSEKRGLPANEQWSLSRKGEDQPREDEGLPGKNGGHGGCLQRMLDKMDTMDLEASQEKLDTVAEHQEVSLKMRLQGKLLEHWRTDMGTGI